LDPNDLPSLQTHEDANTWLERKGRAVATRKVPHNGARAAIQPVEAWLWAEGERVTMSMIDELRAEVERLKGKTGNGAPLRLG
jgi:hypothetical protein